MTSHPPLLAAGGYINAGTTADLRVLNVFAGVTTVQLKANAFEGGIEQVYDLQIVDDAGSRTGKSAKGAIPIAADAVPGVFEAVVDFPEWGMSKGGNQLWVDATDPAEPVVVELTRMTPHPETGDWTNNMRVSPVSRNRWISGSAATGIPPGDLHHWFGLVGDRNSDSAHQTIVVKKGTEGAFDVHVREEFLGDDGQLATVERAGTVAIAPEPPKPVKGGEPFITKVRLDPNKMGDKPFTKHEVVFGEDHEQDNTDYGIAVVPSVTPVSGSEGDLNEDVLRAMRELEPVKVNPKTDRLTFYAGNPAFLRGNQNYRIGWRITITPTKEDDGTLGGAQ